MRIAEYSDLHLEFGDLDIPEHPQDKDTILILAGDIGLAAKPFTYRYFLEDMSSRFQEVIYILGNHEFYKGSFVRAFDKIDNMLAVHNNVHVVDNEVLIFDDVAFICSTLWTNFDKDNPITIFAAKNGMNDYKTIRTGTNDAPYLRKLHPLDTYKAHKEAISFIFPAITEQKNKGRKVVVVTHHAPCTLSIPETFKGDPLNGAYTSDLSESILNTEPDLWFHGHIHNSMDYTLGKTRILCNPRGYYNIESNPSFDQSFRVEI